MLPSRSVLRRGDEAGASSVELLVFFPLLLLIILVTVQVALSWYGHEVAIAAARQTAREAREASTQPADLSRIEADGAAYATRVGGQALTDVTVDVTVVGDDVQVTVTGHSMDIVAGLAPTVRASVTSPVETFREDS